MLSTNQTDWETLTNSVDGQSLYSLLNGPEQMGLAIIKPGNWRKAGPPTGWLGFDTLSFEATQPPPSQTTWVVDGRLQGGDPTADFRTINEAVCDWRVRTGHTVEVVGGQEYAEIIFDSKGLRFHGRAVDGVRPSLTTPLALVNPGAQNHVWLEAGGWFHRFILRGPGRDVGYKFSGFTFTNPSLLLACELTDYPTAGCVAFCAANAIDDPSGIRYNVMARNTVAVVNGDVEHIHYGNEVIDNGIGFDLIAGNSAQVVNNLIVSNWTGVRLTAYSPAWATYTEVANNTVCYNTKGVDMYWTPYPDADFPARSLLVYYDPYLQATEQQVQANWAQYVQQTPVREPACPISCVIRDNIFVRNSAPAIDANTFYGPIRVGSDGRIDPTQGGCYAQIRNNLFFRNHLNYHGEDPNDAYRTSKHFYYELPQAVPDHPTPRFRVPNPPGAPGYLSGRMVQNLFEDPIWANDPPWSGAHPWTVKAEESPCIDAGSATLDLGYGSQAYNGQLVYDRGALDLGFHHWRLMQPELVVTNVAGNRVSVYARNIPTGMQVDVRGTDDLSPGGASWLLEIAVDPEKAPKRGFWWLDFEPPDW